MTNFHLLVAFLATFFISMAALSSDALAQPNLPVTHEIYSWDDDGRVRAFVRINLPDRFDDVEAATIVRVECGDGTVCYHGLLSVVRTENQGAIGTFSLQLSPGVNVLNMYATASDGHGGLRRTRRRGHIYRRAIPNRSSRTAAVGSGVRWISHIRQKFRPQGGRDPGFHAPPTRCLAHASDPCLLALQKRSSV